MATLKKLDNGLELIIEEDHALPVVSLQVLVMAGSASELDREAGIAHFIEHMMFKGTKRRSLGAIASEIEAAGGEINAYTSFDQTVYYLNMASRFWEKGFDVLADAVCNSVFDACEIEREKEVILEEIRRGRDDPGHLVGEYLFKNLYGSHPYGRPIIGYEKTVKSFSKAMILDYMRRWYIPSNMALIAVGDLDGDRFVKLARNFFRGRNVEYAANNFYTEACVRRRHTLLKRAQNNSNLAIGFRIPPVGHPDAAALEITSQIMGGGKVSWLEQELRERERLVHGIAAYAHLLKNSGVFMISAQMMDRNLRRAIPCISKLLRKMAEDGPSESELERARQVILSDEIYAKETVGGLASKYAYYRATTGRYDFDSEYRARIAAVSATDLKRVASSYLRLNDAVVVALIPSTSKATLSELALVGGRRPSRIALAMREANKPHVVALKGGATLVALKEKRLPLVGFCASFKGGIRAESKGNNGISELMVRSLVKGTKRLTTVQLAAEFERMSSHIYAYAGRNSIGVKGQFLSMHAERFWPLFVELLCEPRFDPIEIDKEKKNQLLCIKDQDDDYTQLAIVNMMKHIFPSHPYGMRQLGEHSSVMRLNSASVRRYYRKVIARRGMVIAVVGDVDILELSNFLNTSFTTIGDREPFDVKLDVGPMSPEREVVICRPGREQAHIVIGGRGTTIFSEDRYAFFVLEQILSGQGGRLFLELRDKRGLAYAVGMSSQLGVEPGYYVLYIGTEPSKIDTARSGFEAELDRLLNNPIEKNELERAKNYLIGSYELSRQRQLSVAGEYSINVLYGISINEVDEYPARIKAVTEYDVRCVAAKYMDPSKMVTVVVTP